MELMDIYRQIKNPIDDLEVIKKILNAYSTSFNFYNKLVKTEPKPNARKYYVADRDEFYSKMFNIWKKSIQNMTQEEYLELRRKGSLDSDFVVMRNFLLNVPDATTAEEVDNIIYGKYDQKLMDAFEKYKWNARGEFSGWEHVFSRYLTAKKDITPPVEHRLYLNTETLDTFKMATYLVDKFFEHKMPFYFKFDDNGGRDDTIVIYTSTENLIKHLEVLEELKQEHPDIIARMGKPPVLTGVIDGWIGYGSEPITNGKPDSFNNKRAKAIEEVISSITSRWLYANRDNELTINGKKVKVRDYLTTLCFETFKENLDNRFKFWKGKPEEIDARLGYMPEDIETDYFKQAAANAISNNIEYMLYMVSAGKSKEAETVEMPVRYGHTIKFDSYDFISSMKKIIPEIVKNNPQFLSIISQEIKRAAKEKGIDPNKYCFDILTRNKMESVDITRKQRNSSNQSPKNNLDTSLDLEHVDADKFVSMIDPELRKIPMKFPNGKTMNADEYIKKYVFPHLPENGLVILTNGTVISAQQFVEKYVMRDCQQRYNGDLPKYILEKTKSNFDILRLENGNNSIQITPGEAIDAVNPTILGNSITLPDRRVVSITRYLKAFYSSHIPYTGKVILENNRENSAVQYIEEILLPNLENEYNGNLGLALYMTTRKNKGTIDLNPKNFQNNLAKMKPSEESPTHAKKL